MSAAHDVFPTEPREWEAAEMTGLKTLCGYVGPGDTCTYGLGHFGSHSWQGTTDIFPTETREWRVLMEGWEQGDRLTVTVEAEGRDAAQVRARAAYPAHPFILKVSPVPVWDDYEDADELTKRWAAGDR